MSSEVFIPLDGSLFADRYKPIRLLGKGGMGDVYLVEDTMLDGERVALKLLKTDYIENEKHVARFLREVKLARQVTHPAVVRTYDVGQRDGLLYLTMEYVVGESIKDLLKREGALPHEKVCKIMIPLCEGLAEIHRHQIVHRDLKPANILVAEDGTVKITDFGIARPGSSDLTHHDEIVGSTHYLAPEIWLGKELSSATDIYALGVVMYEMLTGAPPYEADNPAELMWKHLDVVATIPSKLESFIPKWIDDLVLALMAKDQDLRPCNALEIADFILKNMAQEEVRRTGDFLAPTLEAEISVDARSSDDRIVDLSVSQGPVVSQPTRDLVPDPLSTGELPTLSPEIVESFTTSEFPMKKGVDIGELLRVAKGHLLGTLLGMLAVVLTGFFFAYFGGATVSFVTKAFLTSTKSRFVAESVKGMMLFISIIPILVAPLFVVLAQRRRARMATNEALKGAMVLAVLVLGFWGMSCFTGNILSLGAFLEGEIASVVSISSLSLFPAVQAAVRGEWLIASVYVGIIFLFGSVVVQAMLNRSLIRSELFSREVIVKGILLTICVNLVTIVLLLIQLPRLFANFSPFVFSVGATSFSLTGSAFFFWICSMMLLIFFSLFVPSRRKKNAH